MKRLMLLILFAGCSVIVFAQSAITGTVKDAAGKPVGSASVTLKNSDGSIVSFTRSADKGNFRLTAPANAKDMVIEVNMLSFKKAAQVVQPGQTNYDFTLEESAIAIQDVVVRNKPVLRTNGDTLTYRVGDFANKQDRVIGDVLKNMPGIEVADNGKVSYNGKNISNFYINGDNMLDDKYNVATKSIPKEAVENVQVIEKDQPIKMLRGKSVSDDVSINITTTEKAKLKPVGSVSLGGGFPERFDENSSIMLFGSKYKGINYLKGNNIGIDPAQDIISHNMADYMRRMDNSKPSPMLSGGSAGNPDLPQNRHLINRAGLLTVNNLFNLKNDMQLKTNASYLADRQLRDYDKINETYLPGNTFSYSESQQNISRPQQLRAQVSLNANKAKSYFNNTLMADYAPFSINNGTTANGAFLNQQLERKNFDISNELSLYSTLKSGKILNLYSYINRINQPELLRIGPGVLAPQLNGNNPYNEAIQRVEMPTWFTNNYASMKFLSGKISHTYKAGVTVTDQHLESSLALEQPDQTVTAPTLNAFNDLNWLKKTGYLESTFEYQGDKFSTVVSLPLSHQRFSYNDALNNYSGKLNRTFLNPRVTMKYQTGVENYINLSYNLQNSIGSINDIYQGVILTNYRNLFANSSTLPEQQTNTAALSFNYRKAITLFFFNVQATYSNVASNTISSSIITNNFQQRVLLPFDNELNTYSLSANTSKYWFPLRTTLSAGVNVSRSRSNQLQNGNLLPFENLMTGYKAGLITKVTPALNFNYNINYTEARTKTASVNTPGFNQLKQDASITATIFKNVFLNIAGNHLNTKQAGQANLEYFFADASARFKVIKLKTDFEFGISNLANVKTYEAVYLSANSYTATSYTIPGRVAMLKATFSY